MYFNKVTEQAISEFCNSTDEQFRNRIFGEKIYPALSKLAENVIHNRKFYNTGYDDYVDVKHDLVVHLVERLNKFKPEKGSKAFSYFNMISRNWVFAQMKDVRSDTIGRCEITEIDNNRDLDGELYRDDYLNELRDFCYKWSYWGNNHLEYFYFITKDNRIKPFNKKDREIANAIFDLFQNSANIDIIDKKALYIMIRDRVSVKTQLITDVVKVLKVLCKEMYIDYKINGTRYWHRFLYFPDDIDIYSETGENINEA